ncbi:DUF2244 domain-containing protein [Plastoroseomonas arctica]|uniref:DUF2244 domain-containing protein n=1 Tax=Plastoroseomonas arctica TaxID=1509237 RepID=A0AAF1JXV1_9PROT|nr:DUF2244 domain-containing protein [Plastoroseomonas arctica]MBR0654503.1 DUF2244 domain-containing protein [Plastoroseomonas arctica]
MSAVPDPILFEAVSTPRSSFSPAGYRVLVGLLCAAAALPAILFTLMGAWPVLGFLGAEVPLVLFLVSRQARGAERVREALVLTPAGLTVTRTDHRGRSHAMRLDPYWARLEQDAAGRLVLVQRGRRISIGQHLGEGDRTRYATAIEDALRRYRRPIFDNPQLR